MITSATPNSYTSPLRLGSSRAVRALTISITPNRATLDPAIRVTSRRWRSRPVSVADPSATTHHEAWIICIFAPISLGNDDDDNDDGANGAEEEGSVDSTIDCSVCRHASVQYKKGQRSNGVGLGFGLGRETVFGENTDTDTDTSVDYVQYIPRPRVLHPRTTNRCPSSAQSMASFNANGGGITAHETSVVRNDDYTDSSCIHVRTGIGSS